MKRNHLLMGVAGAALVAGTLATSVTPASAFDVVDWEWNLEINEKINVRVDVKVDLDPSGMVKLEGLQFFIGDLDAKAVVIGSGNDPLYPDNGDPAGLLTIDLGQVNAQGQFSTQAPFFTIALDHDEDFAGQGVFHSGSVQPIPSGPLDLGYLEIDLSQFGSPGSLDALEELPTVVANASAFANAQFVETEVATQIHHGQYAFGDFDPITVWGVPVHGVESGDTEGNLMHNAAFDLLKAGGLGLIESGEINATAVVAGVANAQTSATATALANVHTTELTAATPGDAFLVQDLTQFAYMDVGAYAGNYFNSVTHYHNLGQIEGNLHEAVATAVGNLSTVTVLQPNIGLGNGD